MRQALRWKALVGMGRPGHGELVPNFTMLTQNCNAHSLLNRMHKPEVDPETKAPLPLDLQDKRTVVPIEEGDWDQWLNGSVEQAGTLIRLPGDGVQGRPETAERPSLF